MDEEQTLEEFFAGAPDPKTGTEALSRRKFLTGAVAGGAAGLTVAAGTGAAVWKVVDAEAQVVREAAEAELQLTREAAAADVARLQGLVDLYEGLEKVGLDAILRTGMLAVALPLEAVEVGARALKNGLDWAEGALVSLAEALPTARESLMWLEEQVSAVAEAIGRVEESIGQALERATDNAIGQAMRDFGRMVLERLPFGLGGGIGQVLDGLVVLVTGVDDLVAGINTRLLEPLRLDWFSAEQDQGLLASLVDPLIANVLDPLEAHLFDLSELTEKWQAELKAPIEEALTERAALREEIARYKEEHSLT
jgi:hypothetical protein